jgi:hypothetical protein
MRTLTIAVVSFMLGATLVSLYGSQTVTLQPTQGPNIDLGATPVVPIGIRGQMGAGMAVNGGLILLDGLGCDACRFDNTTIRYGGGVYSLNHARFSNSVKFEFSGAAANTIVFLSNIGIGLVQFPNPIEAPNPNKPIIQTAKFEKPNIVSLQSPYGQK